MRRCVIAGADQAREECTGNSGFRSSVVLVTLTYRPDASWDAKHVSEFLTDCREWAKRRKVRYFAYQWVLELTQRGVPHYHVLFWLPHGVRLPKPDDSGYWPHGFSRIERARKPVGYLVKYASKGTFELYALPRGARLFGVGGGSSACRLAVHRHGLPMWLHESLQPGARAVRVSRVGWVCRSTGEIFQSPFIVTWSHDEWGLPVVTIITRELPDASSDCRIED